MFLSLTWFWGSRVWVWFWPSGAWLSLPPTGEPRVVAVMLDAGQIFAILSVYVAGAGGESTGRVAETIALLQDTQKH